MVDLTDSKGRVANFKNTIIIMTSNMGSEIILENFEDLDALGEKHRTEIIETTKVEVFEQLKENLRPEFLNRIDEQIMFLPLTKDEIKQILELLMKKTYQMLGKQGIVLKISEKAKAFLADLGYEPQFGARPLKRVLQKEVINELSKLVLSGQYGAGDTVYVGVNLKGLTFSKEPPTENGQPPKVEENGNPKKEEERQKKLDDLKKATKNVEDAVKKMKKDGNDKSDEN